MKEYKTNILYIIKIINNYFLKNKWIRAANKTGCRRRFFRAGVSRSPIRRTFEKNEVATRAYLSPSLITYEKNVIAYRSEFFGGCPFDDSMRINFVAEYESNHE